MHHIPLRKNSRLLVNEKARVSPQPVGAPVYNSRCSTPHHTSVHASPHYDPLSCRAPFDECAFQQHMQVPDPISTKAGFVAQTLCKPDQWPGDNTSAATHPHDSQLPTAQGVGLPVVDGACLALAALRPLRGSPSLRFAPPAGKTNDLQHEQEAEATDNSSCAPKPSAAVSLIEASRADASFTAAERRMQHALQDRDKSRAIAKTDAKKTGEAERTLPRKRPASNHDGSVRKKPSAATTTSSSSKPPAMLKLHGTVKFRGGRIYRSDAKKKFRATLNDEAPSREKTIKWSGDHPTQHEWSVVVSSIDEYWG